jgi:hypothetical protein
MFGYLESFRKDSRRAFLAGMTLKMKFKIIDALWSLAHVANHVSNNVYVLLGKGDGTFHTQNKFAVGGRPESVSTGDFNGDGKQDIVTAGGTVTVLKGKGDGTFVKVKTQYSTGSSPSLATADFNDDSRTDIAAPNSNGNSVSILLNRTTPYPDVP